MPCFTLFLRLCVLKREKGFDIPYEDCTPVVLAAGSSTRMGRPKALLDFMGCAVVDLVLAACQKAHLGRAFLVIRPDDNALRRHVASYGAAIQIVENPHAEFGQTSSLKAAIPFLPASCRTFLIYPVDYPLVRASDCARLLGAFESSEPGTLIAAPSFAGRRGHPVVVDARLGREFLALPDGGSAREVMNRHADRTAFVAMEDDRVLLDMDTPEDYAACLARFAREAGARPGEKGVS